MGTNKNPVMLESFPNAFFSVSVNHNPVDKGLMRDGRRRPTRVPLLKARHYLWRLSKAPAHIRSILEN
ncbi:hypothetical protein TNCV_3500161 [Trichonephila clavipes]|nr:hypothetical protein TNCV_3500161 [Trichonephila clavipes]